MSLATVAVACLWLSAPASQAAIIAFAGFEASGDTWTGATLSGTGGSFSAATGSGDTPALQRIASGTQSFQTTGIDTTGTKVASTLDFNPVDVSAFDSVQITLRISSTSGTTGNGNDGPDSVKFYVALNGAAFSGTPDLTLSGNANARWGYNATLTKTVAAGSGSTQAAPQGGTDTNNYSTVVITIPASATSVDFRIVANNDNNGEFWNIDNVTLSGNPVPEPSAMMALVGGGGILLGFQRSRGRSRKA